MMKKGWILSAVLLAVFCALIGIFLLTDKESSKTDREKRLADPNLIYFSSYWSGLCGDNSGKEGSCFWEKYLYSTGLLAKRTGWNLNGETDISSAEKKLDGALMENIREMLENGGLAEKDCSPLSIIDAGWEYQVNINGFKKHFQNPPSACKDIFDNIDEILPDDF